MSITLFEDSHWQNFNPISLTKATFDIKIGAKSYLKSTSLHLKHCLQESILHVLQLSRHPNCKVNPSFIDSDTVFVNGLLHPAAVFI